MQNQKLAKQLMKKSKTARYERFGHLLSLSALLLIMAVVLGIIIFIATKGLSTFFLTIILVLKISLLALFGTLGPNARRSTSCGCAANDCWFVFGNHLSGSCLNAICDWNGRVYD